ASVCTVPGHAAAGMKRTLEVTQPDPESRATAARAGGPLFFSGTETVLRSTRLCHPKHGGIAEVIRFRIAILGVPALVGVLAWALPAAAHHSRSLPSTINVTAGSPNEFKFTLSAKSAKSGIVVFKVTNKGKLAHDFSISGRKTPLINPGKSN